jgi:ribosome maturation factor RimP
MKLAQNELIDKLTKIIKPVVLEKGYELYHIEFIEEDKEYYLRVYIDNTAGIDIDDCVKVSKVVSKLLDIEDPITIPYCLEVSSPGINRTLFTEEHLEKYKGYNIEVELKKALNDITLINGKLNSFDKDALILDINGSTEEIKRENIFVIKLS